MWKMWKMWKKKARVHEVVHRLRALTAEERALLCRPTVDPETAKKGDVIETAFGLFLVVD